jgi:hypothetical protein
MREEEKKSVFFVRENKERAVREEENVRELHVRDKKERECVRAACEHE